LDGSYRFSEDKIRWLARGWFRAAWKVDFGIASDPVVLKTLR